MAASTPRRKPTNHTESKAVKPQKLSSLLGRKTPSPRARGVPELVTAAEPDEPRPKGLVDNVYYLRRRAPALGTQRTQSDPRLDVDGALALMFTHESPAGKLVTGDDYEQLLAKRDEYDVFVDGALARRMVRRHVAQGGFDPATLTAPEFEMLIRYVFRHARGEGPCVPARLGVTKQSPGAARKAFIRMRKKVDQRVGGQTYRLFKQRRELEGGGSAYAFEPDPDVRFCIFLPPM